MSPSFRLFKWSRSDGVFEWLIVGLGNPGQRYARNRHNVGFHVLERLADTNQMQFDKRRDQARLALGAVEDVKVILAEPQTYMNLSGRAVGPLSRFYKLPPERVLVIHDDLDLPLGTLRLREQGGAGGHRGIASLIETLNTRDFPRLRVGIDRPPGRMPAEAYVLQDFDERQWPVMEEAYQRAVDAVQTILRDGLRQAMNRFN
jgi:PTH1 family peptidyl-tRNA hydrolase